MNECPMHKVRSGLPELIPNIAKLPVDERGYPVPFFVSWIDGKPDFRIADGQKLRRCLAQRLCWVCGQSLPPLGRPVAFVIGPMCGINRISGEPPTHLECAQWSVKGCPFLSKPQMVRREDEKLKQLAPLTSTPGHMIERNPGVTLAWMTRSFKLVPDGAGKQLFRVGDPVAVSYWKEGRRATRAEIDESIESGLPLLRAMCERLSDHAALDKAIKDNEQFLPPYENTL